MKARDARASWAHPQRSDDQTDGRSRARKRQRPTRSEDFTTGRARRGSSASSGGPSQRHGPSASLGGPSQSHGPPASLGGSTSGHTSAPGRRGGASGSDEPEDTYPQSESSSEELEDTQEPASKRRKQGEVGLSGLPCFDPAELVRSREGTFKAPKVIQQYVDKHFRRCLLKEERDALFKEHPRPDLDS